MRPLFTAIAATALLGGATLATPPARAADWQAGAPAAWQSLLTAAKAESHVAVAGPPDVAVPLTTGFLRDTGIQVDYLGTESRDRSSRMAREVRSGQVTLDIVFAGSGDIALVKSGDFFEDEQSHLLLPGVTDPAHWRDGKLKWVDDAQKYMLQTAAYVTAAPTYDGNEIAPGTLTHWQDLLDPRFKGKIVAYDPRAVGPGAEVAAYIATIKGLDFVRALYVGQNVTYSVNSRQMAEWVARGEYAIGLGVLTADMITLKNAGITNLVPATLADGPGTISGGFSVVLMPKHAPHPNAAAVFLNWIASQPGQDAFSHAMIETSRRTDVSTAGLPDNIVPKPGLTYQDQYNEGWVTTQRVHVLDQVVDAIGGR